MIAWRNTLIVSLVLFACAATAAATDVPVQGPRLSMRVGEGAPAQRTTTLLLRDAAIGAPLPDPRAGGALLLSGAAASAPICWPSDHEGMQLDLDCE
jgi:hypothetical protein